MDWWSAALVSNVWVFSAAVTPLTSLRWTKPPAVFRLTGFSLIEVTSALTLVTSVMFRCSCCFFFTLPLLTGQNTYRQATPARDVVRLYFCAWWRGRLWWRKIHRSASQSDRKQFEPSASDANRTDSPINPPCWMLFSYVLICLTARIQKWWHIKKSPEQKSRCRTWARGQNH